MPEFEDQIRALTAPRNGAYPRPWTTGADDTDPSQADVLIVGASSAKTFRVADVGDHDAFLDALWNRNGKTCSAMYAAATSERSRTRPNLERLSGMLAARGFTSLQTNVACASGRYDADVSDEDRAHGTDIFKVVVKHVPWKAMIVYGVGACERFGRALDVAMPSMPSPDAEPASVTIFDRPVYISPTIAPPSYRSSVWPYLERVVEKITAGRHASNVPAHGSTPLPTARPAPMRLPRENAGTYNAPGTPNAFDDSAANELVWQRMHAIERNTGLTVYPSEKQVRLGNGPEYRNTTRVFRHRFDRAKPEILVRDDVFAFDDTLMQAAAWAPYKVFQKLRTDDLQPLGRVLDAVEAFAKERAA
jgi:hypothetical protein